ncbi:MAG TPA: TetR/AcrR family transcriptional regulator [Rhodocyclaceae bacterium]|nr:TetR/AcrR family transcriptional regulator [Rhodocyclaceae bacterium]
MEASSSQSPAQRQRRKEARPAEMIAAALELFVEKGFAATRMDAIAARAGVVKGTLYLYFDSKETLFREAIQRTLTPILKDLAQMIDTFEGSSADLLRALLNAWWRLIGSTTLGGLPKLMISESRNFPELATYYVETVILPGRDLLRRSLQRGVASGEFRTIDIETSIDVLIAPVIMLVVWRYSLGACTTDARMSDPQTYLAVLLDLNLAGLLKRP